MKIKTTTRINEKNFLSIRFSRISTTDPSICLRIMSPVEQNLPRTGHWWSLSSECKVCTRGDPTGLRTNGVPWPGGFSPRGHSGGAEEQTVPSLFLHHEDAHKETEAQDSYTKMEVTGYFALSHTKPDGNDWNTESNVFLPSRSLPAWGCPRSVCASYVAWGHMCGSLTHGIRISGVPHITRAVGCDSAS